MKTNETALREKIQTMPEQELVQLAESEALAIADSSRLEGLTLDQERISRELLAGYQHIQSKQHP